MAMDQVDYYLHGDDMQLVEIELDPGEAAIGEAGSMMYMEDGIQMSTVFGDGSAGSGASGLLGKLMGAGKRLITGESLFTTVYTNEGQGKRKVAFAAPYTGKIVPFDLSQLGGTLICQKDAFLCAAKGVSLGIAFQRKLGAGFFGGEGLFFATLRGPGTVWLQSLPFARLASRIFAAAPVSKGGGGSGGEQGGLAGGLVGGSLLGGFFGGDRDS